MLFRKKLVFLGLFFVSGGCGLIYEIVWSRLLALVFGGTTFAITTVLSCFMGGLALGSFLAGRNTHRIRNPIRAYGILEIGIGVYCLLIPILLDFSIDLYRPIVQALGQSTLVLTLARVLVCAAILIVPTTFMGATLPIISMGIVRKGSDVGRDIGHLYGFNTIGAFCGTVAVGFFLLPMIGQTASIWTAAFLNVAAGLTAIALSTRANWTGSDESESPLSSDSIASEDFRPAMNRPLLLSLYCLSGFAAMVYQIAWTRGLILSLGSSTYAFSSIVACFILGLALGALLITQWIHKIQRPLVVAGLLEGVIALSALVVVPVFGELPGIVKLLAESPEATFESVLGTEILIVLGLLIVPTLCMGALMPLVCTIYDPRPASAGQSVGNVYASNTAGTIVGSLAAGFVFIPTAWIGMQRSIAIASALSGIVATAFLLSHVSWKNAFGFVRVGSLWAAGIALVFFTDPWSKSVMVMGPYLGRGYIPEEMFYYREGIDTTVAVTGSGQSRTLRVNGKPDASTADLHTQYLIGLIPILLRPQIKEVCVVGLGSGATVGAVIAYPVEHVDVAEISSAVIEAASFFESINNNTLHDPRVTIHRTDGRNLLLLNDKKYDLIISEPSNPWISGVANLFTKEFFELGKSRLKPGGVQAQWVQSYSITADDMGAVFHTFSGVFEYTQMWEMGTRDFLIVGSDEPLILDVEELYYAFSLPVIQKMFEPAGLNDPLQLMYHFTGDGEDVQTWAKDREILTDDRPRLEFSAARALLKDDGDEILSLVANFDGAPKLAGNPDSMLNREVMKRIESRQRGYPSILNVYRSLQPGATLDFDDVRNIATEFSEDMLKMIWLVTVQLARSPYLVDPDQGKQPIDEQFESLREIVPDFLEIQKSALGKPHQIQKWPFNRNGVSPQHEELAEKNRRAAEFFKNGNRQGALSLIDEVLAVEPSNYTALSMRGFMLMDGGDSEQAIPYLLRASSRYQGSGSVQYTLAQAYAMRGDRRRTLDYLALSAQAGFRGMATAAADPAFNFVRNDPRFLAIVR